MPADGKECSRNKWYIKEEKVAGIGYRVAFLHKCQDKDLKIKLRGRTNWDTTYIEDGPEDDSDSLAGTGEFQSRSTRANKTDVEWLLPPHRRTDGTAKFAIQTTL